MGKDLVRVDVVSDALEAMQMHDTAGNAPGQGDYETVEAESLQRSQEISLELCGDIAETVDAIEAEIKGLFNIPKLRAVEHRHRLMGIYRNLEKLYADILAGK